MHGRVLGDLRRAVATGDLRETVFHGRYFNLVEFFNRIERLPRSVKVVFLDIAASDGGLPYLQIRVDFRAFFTTNQGIEGLVQSTAG